MSLDEMQARADAQRARDRQTMEHFRLQIEASDDIEFFQRLSHYMAGGTNPSHYKPIDPEDTSHDAVLHYLLYPEALRRLGSLIPGLATRHHFLCREKEGKIVSCHEHCIFEGEEK